MRPLDFVPRLLVVLLGVAAGVAMAEDYFQPEQIHLSLGVDPSQMVVTWVTMSPTKTTFARLGPVSQTPPKFDRSAEGNTTLFTDGGSEKRKMYIHRATMKDLIPGQGYYYHVGSANGWSSVYWFTAQRNDSDFAPTLAVYGDMGNNNGQSIPFLQDDTQMGGIDAILHVGDFAYNMDSDNARVGDEFMRQIEPIAAYVPYQVCVGNHESAYNFSNYDNKFTMLQSNGEVNNHYFSFNYGKAHIIGFSSEFYFFVEYGWHQIKYQYEWLERDLQEATKPENRARYPWIIAMGHRPMYCSNSDDDPCFFDRGVVRKGLPMFNAYGLEELFYKYGVDMIIGAHEHSYERLWPVYDLKVYNGSTEAPYTNPGAPVHIVTGSAGCTETPDPFVPHPKPWSAFHSDDYGYTKIKIHNATHLSLDQISVDKDGQIVDSIVVIKEKHGPYV